MDLAFHGANREDVAVELLHDKGQVGDEAALTQRAILHMMKRKVVLLSLHTFSAFLSFFGAAASLS